MSNECHFWKNKHFIFVDTHDKHKIFVIYFYWTMSKAGWFKQVGKSVKPSIWLDIDKMATKFPSLSFIARMDYCTQKWTLRKNEHVLFGFE